MTRSLALLASLFAASTVVLLAAPVFADPSLVLRGPKREISGVAISADGKLIAAAAEDGLVTVWDGAAVVATRTPDAGQSNAYSVAFTPDGRLLVVGSVNGDVALWDRAANKDLYAKRDHTSRISQIVMSPDGKSFVTSSWDHTTRSWDTLTGVSKATPKMGYQANGIAVALDGATYTIDSNGGVAVAGKGKPGKIEVHQGEGRAIALSPSGTTLAIGYGDQQVFLADVATQKELRHLKLGDDINSLAFSPDGKTLAIGTQGSDLVLLDLGKADNGVALKGHERSITGLCYTRDGKKLVTGSRDKTVRVWPMK